MKILNNPFKEIVANSSSENLIWAGMHETKTRINEVYHDCIDQSAKELILYWGQFGGGKTFSAFYFLKEFTDEDRLKQIYVRLPKDGGLASLELMRGIVDALSYEVIKNRIHQLISKSSFEEVSSYITRFTGPEFSQALMLFATDDEDMKTTFRRFIYTGSTKVELKKLNLTKALQTETDVQRFLTGILSLFCGSNALVDGYLILWMDEMEDMLYFTPKQHKPFSQMIRDIFDSLSDRVVIFMNFTFSEGQESTLEYVLGGALWSRITRKIRLQRFDFQDAIDYTNELLARLVTDVTHPIVDQKDLEIIIDSIPSPDLTPREINKTMNSILFFTQRSGEDRITQPLISKWLAQRAANE